MTNICDKTLEKLREAKQDDVIFFEDINEFDKYVQNLHSINDL